MGVGGWGCLGAAERGLQRHVRCNPVALHIEQRGGWRLRQGQAAPCAPRMRCGRPTTDGAPAPRTLLLPPRCWARTSRLCGSTAGSTSRTTSCPSASSTDWSPTSELCCGARGFGGCALCKARRQLGEAPRHTRRLKEVYQAHFNGCWHWRHSCSRTEGVQPPARPVHGAAAGMFTVGTTRGCSRWQGCGGAASRHRFAAIGAGRHGGRGAGPGVVGPERQACQRQHHQRACCHARKPGIATASAPACYPVAVVRPPCPCAAPPWGVHHSAPRLPPPPPNARHHTHTHTQTPLGPCRPSTTSAARLA